MVLDLTEAGLTWVEIRTVGHVIDDSDALLRQYLLHRLRLMYWSGGHEDGDPLEFILSSQVEEVLFKLGSIHRLLEDLIEF